jgi:hypothetical protein
MMKEKPLVVQLNGRKIKVATGADWSAINRIAPILYSLTDVKTDEKRAADWALRRAVSLLTQIQAELKQEGL